MLNDRGVAPLIGFILLFAIFSTYLAILQSQWVPEWNRAAEIKHMEHFEHELKQLLFKKKAQENCARWWFRVRQ